MMDPLTLATGIATCVGAAAAGIGLYKFGKGHGEALAKQRQAMDTMITALPRAVDALERSAKAAEENSKLIPLIEAIHEERHQLDLTLRAMARKINTLMRTNEDTDVNEGSRAR